MLHDVEAIVLHDRLGDVELWVQDDTLRDTLAEANTPVLLRESGYSLQRSQTPSL